MKTLRDHLQEKMRDGEFKEFFEEERELLRIALEVAEAREKSGISQAELAQRAKVTQQQISKIENGINCNLLTLLKVCRALNLVCRINSAAA
jgi:HTH-type transcriptional regulator / antitoxin HipB